MFLLQEQFKSGLVSQTEEVKKEAQKLLEEFHDSAPFAADISSDEALSSIAEMRAHLVTLKKGDIDIRKGLGMFKIDPLICKEIPILEKVIQHCSSLFFNISATVCVSFKFYSHLI